MTDNICTMRYIIKFFLTRQAADVSITVLFCSKFMAPSSDKGNGIAHRLFCLHRSEFILT